jgi:hypothetical protein
VLLFPCVIASKQISVSKIEFENPKSVRRTVRRATHGPNTVPSTVRDTVRAPYEHRTRRTERPPLCVDVGGMGVSSRCCSSPSPAKGSCPAPRTGPLVGCAKGGSSGLGPPRTLAAAAVVVSAVVVSVVFASAPASKPTTAASRPASAAGAEVGSSGPGPPCTPAAAAGAKSFVVAVASRPALVAGAEVGCSGPGPPVRLPLLQPPCPSSTPRFRTPRRLRRQRSAQAS